MYAFLQRLQGRREENSPANLKQLSLVLGIFLHLSWKMEEVLATSPLVAKGQLSRCLICR